MPTFPELPRWATGASAEVVEPPGPTKDTGWIHAIRPPHEWMNWLARRTYEALVYFGATARTFSTLDRLIDELAEGDSGFVDENDRAAAPGSLSATSTALAGAPLRIASNGRRVFYALGTATAYAATRTLATMADVTYTVGSPTGTITSVVASGPYVAFIAGSVAHCYNATTGAALWTYDHTATIRDVAIDGARLYIGGVPDASNYAIKAITLATGALAWRFVHGTSGEEVRAIATDGIRVYAAADATGLASGATLRALVASNGHAATTEGGATADTTGKAWNAVQVTPQNARGTLACDGSRLYLGYPSAASAQLEVRGAGDGAVVASVALSGATATALALDHERVYLAEGSNLHAFAKVDLARAWLYVAGATIAGVATDGAGVWLSRGSVLERIVRGNRRQSWQRVAPGEILPYRWGAIPNSG